MAGGQAQALTWGPIQAPPSPLCSIVATGFLSSFPAPRILGQVLLSPETSHLDWGRWAFSEGGRWGGGGDGMRAPIFRLCLPPSKPHNSLERQGIQPFTDGKTEARKDKVRCPRSNSLQVAEPRHLNSDPSASKP